MFRRILVAYDGSPRADDALALAQRLRDPGRGVLTLACVISEQPVHLPGLRHRTAESVREDVALMFEDPRARLPAGTPVRLRSPVASSPARGLTELAEAEGADVIVAGSSRRAPAGRISLERTAGRLLQGAPCAVAIAPADMRDTEPFRHVGVAYDGSPEAAGALAAGYSIAAEAGAAVTLLYAMAHATPIDDAYEHIERRARLDGNELLDSAAEAAPAGVNPRTLVLHGPPGQTIGEACAGIVDLLVAGSRGYGPVQRALAGSVAEELLEGAPHPVLVMPRRSLAGSAPRA